MDTIEALHWRYAVKKFDTNKELSQQQVDRIIEAFNLTPTSYGLQPLKLVVISNKALQEDLLQHSFNQKQVTTASHVLVLCRENKVDQKFIETNFELIKSVRHTPDDVLAPFRDFLIKDFNNKSKEEINLWSTNQAYLALGNILTVSAIEGVDAAPMEGFNPKKYDEILNLEAQGLNSVLVCALGYRAQDDQFAGFKKVRRPLSETIITMN